MLYNFDSYIWCKLICLLEYDLAVYKHEACDDDGVTQFLKWYRRMVWLDIVSMDFLPNDWSGR